MRTSAAVSRLNYQTGRLRKLKAHAITREPYERCGILAPPLSEFVVEPRVIT